MWIFYALGASIMWGLMYFFMGILLQKISPISLLFLELPAFIILTVIVLFFQQHVKNDISTILNDKKLLLFSLILVIASILGHLFIIFSIYKAPSSALAAIIEISYPFFIVLFSILFFKNFSLSWYHILGAILIFSGAALISYFE